MRQKVLLISPNRCTAPEPVFPLGLAHLDAALRAAGHEPRLLDCLADPRLLEPELREFQPDVIGISLRNLDDVLIRRQETYFSSAAEICATVRRVHPRPVVLGGSGFSICPEQLLELSGADFGIQGEGEAGFLALLDALGDGGDCSPIPGLVFRRDGRLVANPQQPTALADRKEIPTRPGPLAEQYLRLSGTLNLQTQRGCRHTCCYCTYPIIEGRTHRQRDPELVAEEFAQLESLGARYVFIVDSVFNSSPAHVTEMCEAIIRRGTRVNWGCFLRPQGLTPALMQLMKRAGLSHIEFGSDSFCDTVLEQYGKQLTFAEILASSELARQAGLEQCHFLICGGPGETTATLDTSYENSRRLGGPVIMAVVGMRIYPGTPLARRAVREGRLRLETDLLAPAYYVAPALTEELVFDRLQEFARRSPNWISGDPPENLARVVARLRQRGILGPLWSYFALLQRLAPSGAADVNRAFPAA